LSEKELMKKPVIIDVDTGIDDALALVFALKSPELEIKAVTVSGGNVSLEQCALNTARIIHFVAETDPDIAVPPVVMGLEPSTARPDVSDAHGADGLGGISHLLSFEGEQDIINNDAVEVVKRVIEDVVNAGLNLTVITTGPLTNLHSWIKKFPELLQKGVSQVIMMGGAFLTCGNRSPVAEFNILSDPEAAAAVLDFCRGVDGPSQPRISHVFVGLDVTHRVALRRSDIRDEIESNPWKKLPPMVDSLTRTYMDFYSKNEGHPGCPLHDPLTVAYAVDPSLFTTRALHVEIETEGQHTRGMTVADMRPSRLFKERSKEKTIVCLDVDTSGFESLFKKRAFSS